MSQKITVLTPVLTSITQNWVKKGPDLYFMSWSIRFWKPLSQNFEVLTHRVTSSPQKWVKMVQILFHVSMLIERWKSKRKDSLRWSICSWHHSLKILKFWLNVVMPSTQNWLEERCYLISYVRMNGDRKWKSKVKGALRWGIRLWNYFLEILQF